MEHEYKGGKPIHEISSCYVATGAVTQRRNDYRYLVRHGKTCVSCLKRGLHICLPNRVLSCYTVVGSSK